MPEQETETTEEIVDEQVDDTTEETTEEQEELETFPRAYVEELREENAKYRQRAGKADSLATRLHTALVAATGRLADASDLPYAEAHLEDDEALTTALDELLTREPLLASRRPRGDVGQGATSTVARSSTSEACSVSAPSA